VEDARDAARQAVEDAMRTRRKQAVRRRPADEILAQITDLVAEMMPAGEPTAEQVLDALAGQPTH
jgi:hypothetical protein